MCFANLYFSPLFPLAVVKGGELFSLWVGWLGSGDAQWWMADEWQWWPICARTRSGGWASTHMLAERCCWEPGRLTMAVECPGEVGVGWYVQTYTDRKDSRAEPVSITRQALGRAAAERPDASGNQEPCPAPPILCLCCGLRLWEVQGGDRLVCVLGAWGWQAKAAFQKTAQIRQRMKTSGIYSHQCTARILDPSP